METRSRMPSSAASALCLVLLSACATSPVPAGYAGPVAKISDWGKSESRYRAVVFYVSEVNGKPIQTSADVTRSNYQGKVNGIALFFYPQTITRDVPAGPVTLKLEGQIMYSTYIQQLAMAATMYSITEPCAQTSSPGSVTLCEGSYPRQSAKSRFSMQTRASPLGR
ncbi:MAG: hypothetical protein JSS20_21080 [Proteobacteria bacterium]|nr:hypothetical protein [Pseudomonadota bacterium]